MTDGSSGSSGGGKEKKKPLDLSRGLKGGGMKSW